MEDFHREVSGRTASGRGPGVHALIVGASAYPNLADPAPTAETFGLQPLESAALTAYKVARWLERHSEVLAAPLVSCELLISPSAREIAEEPALSEAGRGCSYDDVVGAAEAWRARASTRRDDIALFYFAGHGLQPSRSTHVLLLDDFGEGAGDSLRRAIASSHLVNGMAPSSKRMKVARRQLYVLDACRTAPRELREYDETVVAPMWKVIRADRPDDRLAVILYTAELGAEAYGVPGRQSVFSADFRVGG